MATIDVRTSPSGTTSYRVRTRLKGQAPQVKTIPTKTLAKQWAQSIESAQREGRFSLASEAKRHTLRETIARYQREVLPEKPKNARNQHRQLTWWTSELGYCTLADVTAAKIAECRDRLRLTPMANGKLRAPATVVRYLAALSHVFTVAMQEWGWVDDNPLRKVSKPKPPRGRVRFLDDAEREILLSACKASKKSPLLYPIVVLAISTGMRKGEILNLRWANVDLERQRITLHETKNGERRGVPLTGLALELLGDLVKARRADTSLVFPSPKLDSPLEISKAWNTALAKSGIEDFRFHDLRHCAASYLVMNGATLLETGEVLGHKSVQMTKRYAHLAEGHTQRIVQAMNEKIFGNA